MSERDTFNDGSGRMPTWDELRAAHDNYMSHPMAQARKFVKKPIIIEACRWFKNGDHPEDYAKVKEGFEKGQWRLWTGAEQKALRWEGQIVRYYRSPIDDSQRKCQHCDQIMHFHGWIDTLEGGHIVCPGDWIIKGVKGEHYPCKPDIFANTYDPVEKEPRHDAE